MYCVCARNLSGAGRSHDCPGFVESPSETRQVNLTVLTGLMADGRVVEYDQEYWRHDAIRVHIDLKMNAPEPDSE